MHDHQQICFEFSARDRSFLSSEDEGDAFLQFPAILDNSSLVDSDSAGYKHGQRSSLVRKEFSWMSIFRELFISRTDFHFTQEQRPEDLTVSWWSSDEDSDMSTVPGLEGLDEWGQFCDDPSEEDVFCVETVLQRTPSTDSPGEEEESVLVTFSTLG